jgi:hypothetical protein
VSDYTETEAKTPFAIALNDLINRFLGEGTPIADIAAALEEAAMQTDDEELGEDGEWRKKS